MTASEPDTVSLREHIEALFREHDKALAVALKSQQESQAAALASIDRSVTKAEIAIEKRLEGLNEFRATLSDQQRDLLPRPEFRAVMKGYEDQITVLRAQVWGTAVSLIASLTALAISLMK